MGSTPPPSKAQNTGDFAKGLIQHARLIWRLLMDSRVSSWVKLIPVAGLVYLLSPIDLIPDLMLPGLGELDDIAIVVLSLKAFVELAPQAIVRQHLAEMAGRRPEAPQAAPADSQPYIDVPYRIVSGDESGDRDGTER